MLQIPGRLILVIDNKERARQFMEAIPHAKELGIWFATIGQGTVEMHMNYDERFIGNPKTGVIHGGAVFALTFRPKKTSKKDLNGGKVK